MAVITVNKRGRLHDIVNGVQTGEICSFIEGVGNAAINRQATFANKLNNSGGNAYIEVKFGSEYSRREKRIEIVFQKDKTITIFKFSKSNRFDRDAMDIQSLVDEIKTTFSNSGYHFIGTLLFSQETNLDPIRELLKNMNINDIFVNSY